MNFPKFLRTPFLTEHLSVTASELWNSVSNLTNMSFSLQGFTLFIIYVSSNQAGLYETMYSRMDQVRHHHIKPYDLGRPYQLEFFKGCLPQISRGPFLNALPMYVYRCLCVYMNIFRP